MSLELTKAMPQLQQSSRRRGSATLENLVTRANFL